MPYTVNPITGDLQYTPGPSSSSSSSSSGNSNSGSGNNSSGGGDNTTQSGPLAVANGGTGLSTLPQNALLLGNGTNACKTYQLDCPDDSITLTVDDADSEYKIKANFPSQITKYATYSSLGNQSVYNGTYLVCDKDATTNQNHILATYNPVIHNPVITIIGDGTNNWKVCTPYSDTYFMVGSNQSTPGSAGSISSTNPTDAIQLTYINANAWTVQVLEGNVLVT